MKSLALLKISPALLLLLISMAAQAQSSTASSAQRDEPSTAPSSTQGVYTSRDIFAPKNTTSEEPEPARRSFAERYLRGTRQRLGFSFGAYEMYAPDVFVSAAEKRTVSFTSLVPQFYLNAQNKKVDFRLIYGLAHKRFNGNLDELNRLSQNGSAAFTYTLFGRKTTVEMSNYLTSTYYDESSFPGISTDSLFIYEATPRIYLDRTRETRDIASISLRRTLTRKSSIKTSMNYDVAHYAGADLQRTGRLSAGVGVEYQINNWLTFDTRYSRYLNNVDQQFQGDVQSLQVARFPFVLPGQHKGITRRTLLPRAQRFLSGRRDGR